MKLKDTGLLPKKLGTKERPGYTQTLMNEAANALINECGEIEVLERLDEEKVQDELYKTGLYSCWFNTKTDAQSICQKFGTPKIDDLIKSVLTWWKEHQYDTESVSSGEIPEEYNVYDETPDFVKIAQAEDDFHKEG